MSFVLFAIAHFALILLLALLAYVVGRRLTYALRYGSVAEEIVFCTALGLGCIAYVVFFLGVVGLLYPPVTFSVLALLAALCYPVWRDLWRRATGKVEGGKRKAGGWRLRLGVITGGMLGWLALVPIWVMPLYPPTAFDACVYHLAIAKWYVTHGRIVLAEYLRYPLFPQTQEMLHALMLPVSDIAAHLTQFLMMTLGAVMLYAWGKRLFSTTVGMVAAGLWLGNPLVLWLGGSGLIDLGLTLFIGLAAYAVFNWLADKQEWRWLVLAGAFSGFAAGSKYTALFFMGLFGLALAIWGLRRLRDTSLSFLERWKPLALYGAVAGAVASPWYIRNVLHTRNPVEPFLPSVFGYSRLWNETDMENQLVDWRFKGMGTGLDDLLLLPWNLIQNQGRFGNDPPMLTIIYWLLPLTVLLAVFSRKIRGLMIIVLLFALFWFFSGAQIQRYLLPVLPMLVLATVGALYRAVLWLPRIGSLLGGWVKHPAVVAGIAALCLFPGWLYAFGRFDQRGFPPSETGARDAYLARYLPPYMAHKWLNEQRGTQYTVYGIRDDDMAYFTDGLHIGDWLGPGRNADVLSALESGDTLYRSIARFEPDYLLVTSHRREYELPTDATFDQHFKLVYKDPQVQIFEVTSDE